jgi:hypothetical protein
MSDRPWVKHGFSPDFDPVERATNGEYNWYSPGMDDLESGWEPFVPGKRVEVMVRLKDGKSAWLKGVVVKGLIETDRGIEIRCDEQWHDKLEFHQGYGATIMVFMSQRNIILSALKLIDEPEDPYFYKYITPPAVQA